MSFLLPKVVYALCLVASLTCALLLVRSYLSARSPLLLMVAIAFTALAANNLLLVADRVWLPERDLWALRQLSAGIAVLVLIIGFAWRRER